MGAKFGAVFGMLVIIVLIGIALMAFNDTVDDTDNTIRNQNTTESIQETLINE